jgi:hypothetical protein
MWARVVEMLLAGWLLLSPFVFRHAPETSALWWNDLCCGLAVLALALLSMWKRSSLLHLATGLVGLWLIAFGILASPHPAPPALQNDVAVGFLLLMFATIPNEASRPPRGWRDFLARKEDAGAPKGVASDGIVAEPRPARSTSTRP